MINTLKEIKDLLLFDSEDDFYHLQIIQRKKENSHIIKNHRVIKNYYINNIEHLENKMEEIITLCNLFNARAMLNLNTRSYKKAALVSLTCITNNIVNEQYNYVKRCYDKACGNSCNVKVKKWIIDLDGKITDEYIETISKVINDLQPIGEKILKILPTKNGKHLITTPFNLQEFKLIYPSIDVHKNNPINLYIP